MKLPSLPNVDLNILKNLVGEIKKLQIENVQRDERGNVNITGKDAKVLIVNIQINDKTQVLPFLEELKKVEYEGFNNGEYVFSRADNVPYIAETRITPRDYERIIQEISPYIPSKDLGAIRYAALVCKQEDELLSEKQLQKLRSVLVDYYAPREGDESKEKSSRSRGYIIYNWVRCGEVFTEDVIPHINLCLGLTKEKGVVFDKIFLPYWIGLLEFHPKRIFVSRTMYKEELYDELYKRLVYKGEPEVFVYSRKNKNKLANRAVKRFIKDHNEFVYAPKKYTLGETKAMTLIITKKT